jgi:two-component system, NarL family, sensor histidine kinase BarA
MSYRSIKRVLGETRLELKCLLLFAICLLTLIGGSFWWYGSKTEGLVSDKSRDVCQNLVDSIMLAHHWNKDPSQGKEYRPLVKEWSEELQTRNYRYSFIRPDRIDPETEQYQDVLALFPANSTEAAVNRSDGEKSKFWEKRLPERQEYLYFQPIYATNEFCCECHNAFEATAVSSAGLAAPVPKHVGDLMAVAMITYPDGDTQQAININRAIFLATAIVTVFLAMIAAYVIVRYVIVKPLKHLRDVSDEISHGNMEARAEIHTADEFEELGTAFNKMVRHLVTTQDQLKDTNTALDTKIDELAQTNMRLYEMNRLKSDFLATMSHELRTPLNSIIGFSEVLDSIRSLDDKQRRYVQNIQKSGRVLLDMINDILDLAKIESGKMDLRLSDFRIDNVVHAQCDFFRPQTEKKNIDLDVEVEPGLPELFQDQAKVQQILSNLLSNAIKFTPEGGRILVRTKIDRERDELLLMVADTGVGIAEEDQVAIFEKFRQGQSVMTQGDAITREFSGTGLGLSIVKELCKLLGGEVSLESQIGRGSTFTVRLPITCAGQPHVDSAVKDNLEEMLRPWRQEVQRTLERPVPAAPGVDR